MVVRRPTTLFQYLTRALQEAAVGLSVRVAQVTYKKPCRLISRVATCNDIFPFLILGMKIEFYTHS